MVKCPKCGSDDVTVTGLYYKCHSCGDIDDSTFEMIMEDAKTVAGEQSH